MTIVLLGGLVGCGRTHVSSTMFEADAISLASAVRDYYRITGELPSTEQGLQALLERPEDLPPEKKWEQLITSEPTDAWGNRYQYKNLGGVPPEFEIRSFGRDGMPSEHDISMTFNAEGMIGRR